MKKLFIPVRLHFFLQVVMEADTNATLEACALLTVKSEVSGRPVESPTSRYHGNREGEIRRTIRADVAYPASLEKAGLIATCRPAFLLIARDPCSHCIFQEGIRARWPQHHSGVRSLFSLRNSLACAVWIQMRIIRRHITLRCRCSVVEAGYTTVEVQMPKDDEKRPPPEQEQ